MNHPQLSCAPSFPSAKSGPDRTSSVVADKVVNRDSKAKQKKYKNEKSKNFYTVQNTAV